MTIEGEKNIVKLEITVDHAVFMEVLESQAHLGSVKSNSG